MTETTDEQVRTLEDVESPDRRFLPEELLEVGRRYQLVRGTYEPDQQVCVAKAPRYDSDDQETLHARRSALSRETEFRQQELPGLTSVVARLTVDGPQLRDGPESVLLYESAADETLFEYVQRQPTSGLPPKEGLKVIAQVVEWLEEWHSRDVVFVDLDPRHILVDHGLPAGLVGITNSANTGTEPDVREMPHRDAPYVAPEARQERSGKMRRPLSDMYSIGALMSYVLTGHEPTTAVESPLTKTAYNDLMSLRPRGIARLVAGTLHPMAKHRVESMSEFSRWLDDDHLPGDDAEGFQLVDLPAPWSGAEPPGPNRSVRSNLSPGPLISVDRDHPSGHPGQASGAEPAAAMGVDPVEEFSKPEDAEITSREELAAARDEADANPEPHAAESDDDRREISMLDEQLGDRSAEPPEPEPTSAPPEATSEWPAYSDLPATYRLALAFGIPLVFVLIAVVLGVFGIV